MSSERLYLDNLPVIEGVIRLLSQRNRLSAADADEFASNARLKLLENDYEVLRKFEGRATIRTYLTVVLQRVLLDVRVSRWGKWRPSSEAKRRGPVAVMLDQLITRDGLSVDEAIEVLKTNHRVSEDADALRAIAAVLPGRVARRHDGEEQMLHLPDEAPGPDARALRHELKPAAVRAQQALDQALAALSPQDRLIIRLRFHDGLSVAEIARGLRVDQKPLYRRLDQLLQQLRRAMETQGIGAGEAGALMQEAWSDLVEPPAAVGSSPGAV